MRDTAALNDDGIISNSFSLVNPPESSPENRGQRLPRAVAKTAYLRSFLLLPNLPVGYLFPLSSHLL
jgi:hypothetical protein